MTEQVYPLYSINPDGEETLAVVYKSKEFAERMLKVLTDMFGEDAYRLGNVVPLQ